MHPTECEVLAIITRSNKLNSAAGSGCTRES